MTLGVRAWLVAHTAVIADDGVCWHTPLAREWACDPVGVMRSSPLHVGYAAVTATVHRVRRAWGAGDTPEDWDRSGQCVSMGASAVAMLALWLVLSMTFDGRIAFLACLLLAVTRKWSADGADVLTDPLALCLMLWSLALAVWTGRLVARGAGWSAPAAAAVGATAAAAYWVRPEGMMAAVLAAVFWLGCLPRWRRRWRRMLLCLGVMAASAVAGALPYMLTIGGFTNKKFLADFVWNGAGEGGGSLLAVAAAPRRFYEYVPLRQFGNKLFEAMHPGLGFLMLGWLVVCVWLRLRRSDWLRKIGARGGPEADVLLTVSLVGTGVLTILHYSRAGALSHRYLLLPAALLSGLSACGLVVLSHWGAMLGRRLGWRTCRAGRLLLLGTAAILAGLALHTLRPRRIAKEHHLAAARFLRQAAEEGDVLLADRVHVFRYSRLPGVWLPLDEPIPGGRLLRTVSRQSVTLVAVETERLRITSPEAAAALEGAAFDRIGWIANPRAPKAAGVGIYRVRREQLRRALAPPGRR